MSETSENIKLRLDSLIMKAKDSVKETEGLHLRAKGILKDLQEIKGLLYPEIVITTVTNAGCFKDNVTVTIPPAGK
jgi:hypothetical protein